MLRKKPRKKSLASLKRNLWKVFSIWVRQRDADDDGMTSCISCGKVDHWKNMQAGHAVPKSLGLSIYFDPRGVWAQCAYCNLVLEGNQYKYAIALKKRLQNEHIMEELEATAKQSKKYYLSEYEEMILEYQAKIK